MLSVDERGLAARLLHLGGNVESHGGLTRGLRPKDLDDTAAGNAADTQRHIQGQGARMDRLHSHMGVGTQLHDGALAKILLDLLHGGLQRLALLLAVSVVGYHRGNGLLGFGCHNSFLRTAVIPLSEAALVSLASLYTILRNLSIGFGINFSKIGILIFIFSVAKIVVFRFWVVFAPPHVESTFSAQPSLTVCSPPLTGERKFLFLLLYLYRDSAGGLQSLAATKGCKIPAGYQTKKRARLSTRSFLYY